MTRAQAAALYAATCEARGLAPDNFAMLRTLALLETLVLVHFEPDNAAPKEATSVKLFSADGPYIVWENLGCEGWQPKSFATIKEAVEAVGYDSVVTSRVNYEVIETTKT
jgi:hypothetical protein